MRISTHCYSRKFLAGVLLLSLLAVQSLYAETIRVLLVYDTTAKSWVDSNGGMALFAANTISKMNQATANSGINLTFELAYAGNVSYTYSNFDDDLDNLQSGAGNLASVHQWRDTYSADVVAMLVDTGSAYGTVGLGYRLTSSAGQPDYAFTVNAIRSVSQSHTLTHEVGHNLGCHHSKNQTSDPGPNTNLNTYSAGWYFTGNNGTKYHTIMAYDDDGYGNMYTECPQFSTPLRTYQGVTAGHAANGDNARTIRETMGVVAAYRSAPPANDNFANAATLSGNSGTVNSNSSMATSETGEPAHAGEGPYKSIWYKFTPASSGILSVDTHGSAFDTVLAVYTGSSVGSLTEVSSNDDDDSAGNCSGTNAPLTSGTTYRIAVAGYDDSEAGSTVLNWAFTPAALPSVTLSIGSASMVEAGGVCIVTAKLSAVSGSAVTVGLSFSGTATLTTDYTRSATSIVIAAGSTAGTITLTAVQDTLDEDNETIVVDITSVANGTESGTQQATATIMDDDSPPTVTLGLSGINMAEAGGTCIATAKLSAVSSKPVTVGLSFSGTATLTTDYTRTATSIVIAAGSTAGTITLTAVQDAVYETNETIVVDITSVVNGTENGTQQATATIVDDDSAADSDSDGLPDSWETTHFKGATNATATADSDGDGFNNLYEYISDTNPTNKSSYFNMSSTRNSTAGAVIRWAACSGRVYGVYWATNLQNSFQPLKTNIIPPQASYTDTTHNANSRLFYKVKVQMAP